MKACFLLVILTGLCHISYAQVDLLLLPRQQAVADMDSVYKSWEFSKQSEEFTNGVSYDLYEYSPKVKSAGDLTILFDKNGICIRVMFYNSKEKLRELVENRDYISSGRNTWTDSKTGSTVQAVLRENPGGGTATIEFIHLGYKPAL